MFLSRFRVRGYKCLEDVELPLTPIHVLTGQSDSGKTSLLEAISAFYGRLKSPAVQWLPAVVHPRELVTHGISSPTIDLAGQWSETSPDSPPLPLAGYGYSICLPSTGQNYVVMDQWVRPRASEDPRSGLSRAAIAFPHRGGQAKAADHAAQAAFRDTVQRMLQPAPVYHLDPRRLAEAAEMEPSRSGLLAADGHGLPLVLDEIAQRHPGRFAEIEAEFCRLAPQYRGLRVQSQPAPPREESRRGRRPRADEPTARGLGFETASGRKLAARGLSGLVALVGPLDVVSSARAADHAPDR